VRGKNKESALYLLDITRPFLLIVFLFHSDMHIIRTGGKYAREQQRLYGVKAVIFALTGVALLIFLSHLWLLSLIFFGCGLHYFKRRSNWHKGILGEKMVVEALTPLDNSYVLINDVILPERRGNIDHILVGSNGVFAIETKSYKWHSLNRFPIRQAICNAVSLRYFLKENVQVDMFIPAILVSTDPNATASQSSSIVNVITLRNLCDFIKNQRNQSWLDIEVKKKLRHELLRASHTTSQKEVTAQKWLLKYIDIGLLAVGLIVYLFLFSGGNPYGKWVPVTGKVKNIQIPSEKVGKIIGNLKSKIYHLPGQANYKKGKEENRVYFDSEEEAIRAGYRKAKR